MLFLQAILNDDITEWTSEIIQCAELEKLSRQPLLLVTISGMSYEHESKYHIYRTKQHGHRL